VKELQLSKRGAGDRLRHEDHIRNIELANERIQQINKNWHTRRSSTRNHHCHESVNASGGSDANDNGRSVQLAQDLFLEIEESEQEMKIFKTK